jgi:hypothetical protein
MLFNRLTTADRRRLPSSEFALPADAIKSPALRAKTRRGGFAGAYPMDTRNRGANARARAVQMLRRGHLSLGEARTVYARTGERYGFPRRTIFAKRVRSGKVTYLVRDQAMRGAANAGRGRGLVVPPSDPSKWPAGWAWTVVLDGANYSLGVVREGFSGYLSTDWTGLKTWGEAEAQADRLNALVGVSREQADKITMRSMGFGKQGHGNRGRGAKSRAYPVSIVVAEDGPGGEIPVFARHPRSSAARRVEARVVAGLVAQGWELAPTNAAAGTRIATPPAGHSERLTFIRVGMVEKSIRQIINEEGLNAHVLIGSVADGGKQRAQALAKIHRNPSKDVVYLGRMGLGTYELTVVSESSRGAWAMLSSAFRAQAKKHGEIRDDLTGRKHTFKSWFEHVGGSIKEFPFDEVQWL